MFVEFQVATAALATNLRSRLKAQPICAPFQHQGYVVDHVEVLDDTVVITVPSAQVIATTQGDVALDPAYIVRLNQSFRVTVVLQKDLENAGTSPPSADDLLTGEIMLLFTVAVQVVNDAPELSLDYAGVDLGSLAALIDASTADELAATVQDAVGSLALVPPTQLDLEPIGALVGHPVTASNVGVGTDAAGTFIAVRIEVDGPYPTTTSDWAAFYQAPIANHLGGRAWCLLVPHQMVVQGFVERVAGGLNEAEQQGTFLTPGYPSGTWKPSLPGVRIEFSGEVPDACPVWIGLVYVGMTDVDVDVTADAVLSVPPEGNVLVLNLKFNWDVDDGEAFACAISAFHFWPAAGSILMAEGQLKGNDSKFFSLGVLAGPFVTFLAVLVVAGTYEPGLPPPGGFEKVPDDETDADLEYVQRQQVNLPEGFTLTDVFGTPAGPVLAGTLPPAPEVKHPPQLNVYPSDPQFRWSWADPCNTPTLTVAAGVSFGNPAAAGLHTLLHICDAVVLDDDKGQFAPHLTIDRMIEGGEVRVRIPADKVLPTYLNAPYDCKLLCWTNGGARLITIPAFTALAADELVKLNAKLIDTQVTKCKKWAHWYWGGHFDLRWLIDPPWDRAVVRHLWTVVLAGCTPGGEVRVEAPGGPVLAKARIGAGGGAQLTAFTDPRSTPAGLVIRGDRPSVLGATTTQDGLAPARIEPERAAGVLTIRQALLVWEATLAFADPVSHLSGGPARGGPALFCVAGGSLRVYNVRHPATPSLVAHFPRLGLTGFLPQGEGGIGWGRNGLVRLTLTRTRANIEAIPGPTVPVLGLVRHRGWLYALTEQGLEVHGPDSGRVGGLDLKGFTHLVVSDKSVILAGPRGLLTLAPFPGLALRSSGSHEFPHVTGLWDPRMVGRGVAVFVGERTGGGRVWELNDARGAVELSVYEHDPWFVGTARVGGVLVRVDAGGRRVGIYRFAGSLALTETQIGVGRDKGEQFVQSTVTAH